MAVAVSHEQQAESFVTAEHKLLIDGEWVASASGETFETLNPATEEKLADVAHGKAEDIERAVKAARAAFADGSEWRTMNASDRGRLIWKISELIEENGDELAMLEALDNGKPFARGPGGGHPAGRGPVPLHGGVDDQDRGQDDPDLGYSRARQLPRLHAARSGRRGRPDHPVELPAADGGVEAGTGSGCRLHRGAQAGRADAAVGPAAGRA